MVAALLRDALAKQRGDLRRAVDGQVLQYACLSLQDMQDIHRATPSEALHLAIENLTAAIIGLRDLVEGREAVDEEVERRAFEVVSDVLAELPAA